MRQYYCFTVIQLIFYLKLMYHCITYINQRINARISQYFSYKLCSSFRLFSWSNWLLVCFRRNNVLNLVDIRHSGFCLANKNTPISR